MDSRSLDQMVRALVPSLSRSLAQQFNVFRVMHHGTHEKQLSNVFAWLLRADENHGLGDAFQRLFVQHVRQSLPLESPLHLTGYRVTQEVDTTGHDELGKDIADIVLTHAKASIVVENYGSSDGHGHGYHRYLAHGASGDRLSVVVLLCATRVAHRQTDGWESAVVVTYAELLGSLKEHIDGDAAWRKAHPDQRFFINQLVQHFVEGPMSVSDEDRIAFIKAMCDTGESERFAAKRREQAAQDFADVVALHAKRQFEDGRSTLERVKKSLRGFVDLTLRSQVDGALVDTHVARVNVQIFGQWAWTVALEFANPSPTVCLVFGPTAVVENGLAPQPVADPDFSKVFVTRTPAGQSAIDRIVQTEVGLEEVLAGLSGDDTRLRDAVLSAISGP
jgi:hypothetical protein